MIFILMGLGIWIWVLHRANRELRKELTRVQQAVYDAQRAAPPARPPEFQVTMGNGKTYTYQVETEADAIKALWADGHDHRKVVSVERRTS